jgi:hypothetical protein
MQPDIKAPTPEDTTDSYMAGLDTTAKGTEALIDKINEPVPQQAEKTQIMKEKDKLSGQKADVQETALDKAEEFGYTKYTKELQQIMPQISKVQAEYNNIAEQISQQPLSSRIIGGTLDRLQRTQATKLAGLSSIAQAYQGNIQLATQTAQDMVDMELAPIQTRIDNQKWQLDQVQDQLTDAQSRKASSLNLILEERQREIDNKKETKTNIANIGLQAAQNGANQSVIEDIFSSKTYSEAITKAGKNLSNYKLSLDEKLALYEEGLTLDENGNLTNIPTDITSASAEEIANSIKQVESGGNYYAEGGSGEYGAYQFMPETWASWSKEYANKVLKKSVKELEPTPENQDAVALWKIKQWVSNGLSPQEVAAKWNSGSEKGWEDKIGVNSFGVKYNVPAYVKKVTGVLSSMTTPQISSDITEVSPEASSWVNLINKGKATIANVPGEELKSEVAIGLDVSQGSSLADASLMNKLQGKIDNIDSLLSDDKETISKDGKRIVGPTGLFGRFRLINPQKLSGKQQNFVSSIKLLISQETLDTLINLKKAGGTLGALSQTELAMLENAASKINGWELKDDNGIGRGVWEANEKDFATELKRLQDLQVLALERAKNDNGKIDSIEQYLGNNPQLIQNYNIIVSNNPSLTDEEVLQVMNIQ